MVTSRLIQFHDNPAKDILHNRILIIGATGNIGRHVVSQLAATGVQIRALARNPSTAALPPQVDVRRADLTIPKTLDTCLDGIDTVFMVWVSPADTFAPVLDRIAKYARRIVFLSAPIKTAHPLFQQPNPSRARTEQYERLIEKSGLQWTYLRPGMLASNALGWWAPQIKAGDVVRWPYLAVPTAPIDERDIAAVAIRTLCGVGHAGAEYVLTGPESLNQFDQIATIGHGLGRALRIEEITPEEWLSELPASFPPLVAKMLLDAWAAAAGQPAFVTSTVSEITGTPPRAFREWVADNVAAFR